MNLAMAPPSGGAREPNGLRDGPPRVTPDALPCRNYEPDLWFSDSPAELELAKSLCAECPVRLDCLAGAVEREEPWGVWGGEIFERGAVVPRKRPRGRPRKADLARDAELSSAATARAADAVRTAEARTTMRLAA